MFNSPAPKQPPVNGENSTASTMSRGIKRKADPYDLDDADDGTTDSKTPSTQRVRSRVSSEAPSSPTKLRLTASKNKRRSRSLSKRPEPNSDIPTAAPTEALPQPNGDLAPRGSLVPVADMGGADLISNEPPGSASKATAKPPVEADAKEMLEIAREKREEDAEASKDAEDSEEELEVEKLLKHRRASDGTVELLVKWVGEPEEDASYLPEDEIQQNAAEALFEYWESQGGRYDALFTKPKNPPPEVYHVFKILRHEKKGTIFQFEVQWVGYTATPGNTTMEPEVKLKKIAPEMLEKYWESQGGRGKFLAKRGRAKKVKVDHE